MSFGKHIESTSFIDFYSFSIAFCGAFVKNKVGLFRYTFVLYSLFKSCRGILLVVASKSVFDEKFLLFSK